MYIDNTPGKKEAISSVHLRSHIVRLLAVPFGIVKRACEIAERANYQQRGQIGARRKKREETGRPCTFAPGFGFFAQLFRAFS